MKTPERWWQIESLYHGALARPQAERAVFLDAAVQGDAALQAEVQTLLAGITPAEPPAQASGLTGKHLGVFEVRGLLGAGGMGEVYRALDTTLGREVALKFLPEAFLAAPDRVARFAREARVLASLNHPNIAAIYGVEVGRLRPDPGGGVARALILELVEGDTLADLVAGVAARRDAGLPVPEAVRLARQLVDALDAAHRKNIVHRDLKPDNIKVTPGGVVKVLDFGLARITKPAADPADPTASTQTRDTTLAGHVVGTPAYMSPEQARAGAIDARTDIWAFGCVLYEMLTGRPVFARATVPDTMAAVLEREPEWSTLPAETPESVRRLLVRCLEKDVERRLRDIGDARSDLALEPSASHAAAARGRPLEPAAMRGRRLAVFAALVITLALVVAAAAWLGVGPGRPEHANVPGEARPQPVRVVALMPFADAGAAPPDRQAYARGLAAAIADRLRQAAQLEHASQIAVVPAAEVAEAGLKSPQDVQRTLGATMILTGQVVRDGPAPRLTLFADELRGRGLVRTARQELRADGSAPALHTTWIAPIAAAVGLKVSAQTLEALTLGGTTVAAAEDSYLQGRGQVDGDAPNLDGAVAAFGQAVLLDPGYALAQAALGDAYVKKYRATREASLLEQARMRAEQALALAPGLAYAHAVRGRIYEASGQTEQAVRELESALRIDAGIIDARRSLAAALEARGDIGAAEDVYRQELAANSHYWSPYVDYGSFLIKQGRYREAETHLVTGLRLAPDNARAIANLAGLYILTERLSAAEAELKRVVALRPEVVACNNLAWVHVYQGRIRDAVPWMEQAVTLPHADSFHWGNLARLYRWAGRVTLARSTYVRAIDMARREVSHTPGDARLRSNLAQMLAETGRHQEALIEITATLERASGNVSAVFRQALVLELAGNRAAALDALEKAVRGGYSGIDIRHHPDLARLRADPRYTRMMTAKQEPASP